jgi:hypothetical protein
MGAMP